MRLILSFLAASSSHWLYSLAWGSSLSRQVSADGKPPTTLKDEDIWKIAMFLKQMDKLPPAVDAQWKEVPSAAATPLK
jgi:hypothetical protein